MLNVKKLHAGISGKEILKGLFETNHKQPPKDYYKIKDYKNKYIKIQDYINGTRN